MFFVQRRGSCSAFFARGEVIRRIGDDRVDARVGQGFENVAAVAEMKVDPWLRAKGI